MSAPEPFAKVVPTGVEIADERVCSDDVLCVRTSDGRQRVADAINAAVAERERTAIESALGKAVVRVCIDGKGTVACFFGLRVNDEIVSRTIAADLALMAKTNAPNAMPFRVDGLDVIERQAAARALREAANALHAMSESESSDLCGEEPKWLRARADRAERGET